MSDDEVEIDMEIQLSSGAMREHPKSKHTIPA